MVTPETKNITQGTAATAIAMSATGKSAAGRCRAAVTHRPITVTSTVTTNAHVKPSGSNSPRWRIRSPM